VVDVLFTIGALACLKLVHPEHIDPYSSGKALVLMISVVMIIE
jgi:hypothetical protein